MIAALFVQEGGVYWDLPDVDPWGEARDARKYAGPYPVVAHPPCARWCRLAGLVSARWAGGGEMGPHKRGEDGGCFASALRSARTWGGVLEHPAYSDAFAHHGLPIPTDKGGWQRGLCGGWVCHVEQWHYGHAVKKATWLYVHGVSQLPSLRWGATPDHAQTSLVERWSSRPGALVSWCGNHVKSGEDRPRIGKKAASATPIAFRDLLLGIARSTTQETRRGP